MKKGDLVVLRDGRKGKVYCPGFSDFILLEDGERIYLVEHLDQKYTPDLNHKKDPSLDVMKLNNVLVKKKSTKQIIAEIHDISKSFEL